MIGKVCGTKSRRRQRTKYTDSRNNFVTRKESLNIELIKKSDDRSDWKAMNRPDNLFITLKEFRVSRSIIKEPKIKTHNLLSTTDISRKQANGPSIIHLDSNKT